VELRPQLARQFDCGEERRAPGSLVIQVKRGQDVCVYDGLLFERAIAA
jgi:hypothetical protein